MFRQVSLPAAPAVGDIIPHPLPHSSSLRSAFAAVWKDDLSPDACCLLHILLPKNYPCLYYGPPPVATEKDHTDLENATGYNKAYADEYEVLLPPANYRVVEVHEWDLSARVRHVPEFFGNNSVMRGQASRIRASPAPVKRKVYVVRPERIHTYIVDVARFVKRAPYAQRVKSAPFTTPPASFAAFSRVSDAVDKLDKMQPLGNIRIAVSESSQLFPFFELLQMRPPLPDMPPVVWKMPGLAVPPSGIPEFVYPNAIPPFDPAA